MGTSKLLRCAYFAMGMLWASACHAALQDGLVSYWPMNGNFEDARGVNDGNFVGGTPTFAAGKFGQGIDLNGTTQYINAGNDESLDMSLDGPAGNGHVSISAWFRVDAFDITWQALLAKGEGNNFRIARRDVNNIMSYAGGTGDIPTADGIGPNVNNGLLHHLVAISQAGVSTRLWVDGTLVATNAVPPPVISNAGNLDLLIGENPGARGRYWDGLIDDVAIWNRPLLDAEIASLWNGGTGAAVGSLVPAVVAGDVNGDGVANSADFEPIRLNFLQSVTARTDGDLNADGLVDFADFREWKAAAGLGSSSAVPEPTVYLLVVVMGLGVSLWPRRLRRRSAPMPA
jgi:concanavalin A-like lectin/glucanase superfamily protein